MKKICMLCIVAFFAMQMQSKACPICGCGVGGFYIGLLPTYQTSFFGLRYQYASYTTHLKNDTSQFSNDHYRIVELWGGFTIGKKWQILGFVPYHINVQNTDDGLKKKNGLGDVTLLANYKIWKTSNLTKNSKPFTQELWIGAGVKLPTGTYSVDLSDPETELGDVNSQMGTGSVDFIANAMYNIRINKIGINTTVNYKVNTTNNSDFKYGDRFSANSFVYYGARIKNTYIAPNVGILYEYVTQNYLNKAAVDQTGGYVTLASAGAEINLGKVSVGTNVQLPFAQDYAQGQTTSKVRGLVHVTFNL